MLDLEFNSIVFVLKQSIPLTSLSFLPHHPRGSEEHLYRQCTVVIWAAHPPLNVAVKLRSLRLSSESRQMRTRPRTYHRSFDVIGFHVHALNLSQAANIAKDNLISTNIKVLSEMCITTLRESSWWAASFSAGSQERRCDVDRGSCTL